MPLDQLTETLSDGLIFRVAEDGHRVPNVEMKFPSDEYDRISLSEPTTIQLNDTDLRVGSLELQIAYKLWMGGQRDFEDALHLYHLIKSMLNTTDVEDLGVEDEYERLKDT